MRQKGAGGCTLGSGTLTAFRDLGFALAPAIIGAVALGRAAGETAREPAGYPGLSKAYEAFQAAAAHAPADRRPRLEAAVHTVASGPLGANPVPATVTSPDGRAIPFTPLKDVAFDALGDSHSIAYTLGGMGRSRGGGAHPRERARRSGPGRLDDDPNTLGTTDTEGTRTGAGP